MRAEDHPYREFERAGWARAASLPGEPDAFGGRARKREPDWSLNDLRALQQRRRDGQAERLGRLEIDHQFEPRGLLDGKVAWIGAGTMPRRARRRAP